MESLPTNPDISAVNPDIALIKPVVAVVSVVTIPQDYLIFLEDLVTCAEEPLHCEEIFAITVYNNERLRELLVRQDVTPQTLVEIQDYPDVNTQFDNIFYSDVTIEHRSEYTETTKKKLIKWYLSGCGHLAITDEMSAIYIQRNGQNCEIKSTSPDDNGTDTYFPGCDSEYFIDVSYIGLRKCYDLCIDLKKSNRLSESDKVIHIMSTY